MPVRLTASGLLNAQAHVLIRDEIVGIQLMAAPANFNALVDDFWTVVASTRWS
jgi:hypothetical protein